MAVQCNLTYFVQDKDSGVQKKSYKVVAYLCESRPDFVRANLQVRWLPQSITASCVSSSAVHGGRLLLSMLRLQLTWCNDEQLDCP